MRSSPVPVVPVFRSRVQAELLGALLLAESESERTVGELASMVQSPLTAVSGEVSRLEQAHIVRTRKVGTARMVEVNREHPAIGALTELVRITQGPALAIPACFESIDAEAVVIFGSWAERYFGHQGHPPNDVDVLVLADDVQRSEVYEAADRATERLGISVNPVLRPTHAWNDEKDPLVQEIRSRPYIVTNGDLP